MLSYKWYLSCIKDCSIYIPVTLSQVADLKTVATRRDTWSDVVEMPKGGQAS